MKNIGKPYEGESHLRIDEGKQGTPSGSSGLNVQLAGRKPNLFSTLHRRLSLLRKCAPFLGYLPLLENSLFLVRHYLCTESP